MTRVWRSLLVFVILVSACTTLNVNDQAIRRACRNGISEYDDGSTNFKCYPKGK